MVCVSHLKTVPANDPVLIIEKISSQTYTSPSGRMTNPSAYGGGLGDVTPSQQPCLETQCLCAGGVRYSGPLLSGSQVDGGVSVTPRKCGIYQKTIHKILGVKGQLLCPGREKYPPHGHSNGQDHSELTHFHHSLLI